MERTKNEEKRRYSLTYLLLIIGKAKLEYYKRGEEIMKNKIVLNLAISLDGYIAAKDGSYDWIQGDQRNEVETNEKWSHANFLDRVDAVVMGKKCYDQKLHSEYRNKEVYVLTSENLEDYDSVHFINSNSVAFVQKLREEKEGDIYLFGGGITIDSFIKENIIDEYIVGIIPVILGSGRPLFLKDNPQIQLTLKNYYIEDGITVLQYTKQ